MGLKFFHIPKPKHFHIDYRYYDPRKEAREKREKRIKAELGLDDKGEKHDYHSSIKGSFRGDKLGGSNLFAHKERRKSNLRLALIIVLLVAILYFFFLK